VDSLAVLVGFGSAAWGHHGGGGSGGGYNDGGGVHFMVVG